MKHTTIALVFISVIIATMPLVIAQANIDITATGTCQDFVITISANPAALPGCWDAKIDGAVAMRHADAWKSSFFYVEDAVCDGSGSVEARFVPDARAATLKLRQGETIVEQPFMIAQTCAAPADAAVLWIAAILAVIVGGAIWYTGRAGRRRKP